jgi:ubiquinone/menaquinone biosynthesis C-methylase UbiE
MVGYNYLTIFYLNQRRNHMTTPPVCNYEGSDYQTSFWDKGGREYEDRTEAIALQRLLPQNGRLLLELGAGAGRNTPRYLGFDRIVLLDYSRTQLEQAQQRLGTSDKYIYVAADAYRLPFIDGLFDAATMIRTLHHMADAPKALEQVKKVMRLGGTFILEFASKLNLKAIFRYWLGRQAWNPFSLEPVEFVKLNFDFHPRAVRKWLTEQGFTVEKILTVSHFRVGLLKRLIPTSVLVFFDSLFQWTGQWWQLSPSVFVKSIRGNQHGSEETLPRFANVTAFFKCPDCGHAQLEDRKTHLECYGCGKKWEIKDGIYDFREPK